MLQIRNDAFLIEVGTLDAGVAIRDGHAFHFVSADPRFQELETRKFGDLGQLQRAADALGRHKPRGKGRRIGHPILEGRQNATQ
ncbi:hypothetical protein [Oceanibaculum pacificum]|uniref:Uncharacterized protein n=1 Tax=Oceanibaculum pacificum TaxID=580166 RepID=A0A154W1I3_9PROT|nr:hypothetical protein [Oceanibaculum pacificum]KZD07414.1 hypothetical protein AUP43_02520 [Oceanibaculum pacificum]